MFPEQPLSSFSCFLWKCAERFMSLIHLLVSIDSSCLGVVVGMKLSPRQRASISVFLSACCDWLIRI